MQICSIKKVTHALTLALLPRVKKRESQSALSPCMSHGHTSPRVARIHALKLNFCPTKFNTDTKTLARRLDWAKSDPHPSIHHPCMMHEVWIETHARVRERLTKQTWWSNEANAMMEIRFNEKARAKINFLFPDSRSKTQAPEVS